MVRVGHVITQEHADSKFLARFRMVAAQSDAMGADEWTESQADKKAKAAVEREIGVKNATSRKCAVASADDAHPLNNFVTLKYDLKTAGKVCRSVVMWAPPLALRRGKMGQI